MDVLQFLWQHYMEYENGWTPIHMAAAKGHTEIINYCHWEMLFISFFFGVSQESVCSALA